MAKKQIFISARGSYKNSNAVPIGTAFFISIIII